MWTPVEVEVVIIRERPPLVEEANDCEATDDPFRDVIVPPAPPASVPQEKVPLAQRSFSVAVLQAERFAPNSDARVRPPVDEALEK